MVTKGVIIHGSSRSFGNTRKLADHVADLTGFGLIDLCEKDIGPFDYDFLNSRDDFLPLMRQLVRECETMVFATPVYWYSMSGVMKDFIDRFTDLLRTEKEIGRRLRGKKMAMISCGGGDDVPVYFRMPFVDTAAYLGMEYLGELHGWIENGRIPDEVAAKAAEFAKIIRASENSISGAAKEVLQGNLTDAD